MYRNNFDPLVKKVAKSSNALGHPLRIEIYKFILEKTSKLEKVKNKDIVDKFGYSQSTISGHMDVLVSAEIVQTRKEKTSTIYTANFLSVNNYLKDLTSLARMLKK